MTTTWVLVANSSIAKIFEIQNMGRKIKKVDELFHESGRLKPREVYSDSAGRSFARMGGSRHALSTEVSMHEHEQMVFAKQLMKVLDKGRMLNSFDELVLVAPPKFLGKLNQAMPTPLKNILTQEVNKDFSMSKTDNEVIDHLSGYLGEMWNR
jgi:protein required for attachment to host cells